METKVTRERLITFLLETPMFEKLVPSEIMEIIHIVEVEQYQAGDVVFREGDKGDAWFVLYRGSSRGSQAWVRRREKDNRAWAAGLLW